MASCMRSVRFAALLTVNLFLLESRYIDAADWPVWGRDITRNSVSPEKNPPIDWDVETGRNIKWSVQHGSMSHGTPIVADGQVYLGTNNGNGFLNRYPKTADLGVMLCFRESDGKFLWQYSAEKLPRVHDWPLQGIGSSPLVEGNRLWFVSNRWEVVCLDTQGFRDKENDGLVIDEPVVDEREADVVWRFDMMDQLGVFPSSHGMGPTRHCSPAVSYKNFIYVATGNGVDAGFVNIPKPEAPSLVCLNKTTGNVIWTDNSPGANILYGQYASPLVAEIADRGQVIVPQDDGWIRSFDALTGELIWKFDINPKDSIWRFGGGTRNIVLATPVLYRNRIYIASGLPLEHGEGRGRLVCIDPTRTGDISTELAIDSDGKIIPHRRLRAVDSEKGERAIPNPNSGVIWEFTSEGKRFEQAMQRTMSAVAIKDEYLIVPDYSGLVHCFDVETGRRLWFYDCFAAILSSPLIVDDYVYVADQDGDVAILQLNFEAEKPAEQPAFERRPSAEFSFEQSITGSPIFANGTLYVPTRSMLYAISSVVKAPDDRPRKGSVDRAKDAGRIPNAAFTPTPLDVVAEMLKLADVKANDVLYDLGSGDGRIVIAAAKVFACRAVGYEIDAELVKDSQANAKDAGVENRVTFHHADLFTADLENADVVTLYLLPIQNERLNFHLKRIKTGARIVSHHFCIPGLVPDKIIKFESNESRETHQIFLYAAPLKQANTPHRELIGNSRESSDTSSPGRDASWGIGSIPTRIPVRRHE